MTEQSAAADDRPSVELSREVRPSFAFRLPRHGSPDGLLQARGGNVRRLVHVDGVAVLVGAAQPAPDRVLFRARSVDRARAEEGIARLRFMLGVDDDVRAFHERFRWDPLIGRSLRADPGRRVLRKPEPFEALAWAICEQLIEFGRAVAIERRILGRLGRRCPHTGLRDAPTAAVMAGIAPARLESFALTGGRALTLVRAAREIAAGRVDLGRDDHEVGWARLRRIPGIGPWTVEMLALTGQGRLDLVPAGDVGYLKMVGRLRTGDPRARVEEDDVREFFAPYAPWAGLAASFALADRRLNRACPAPVRDPGRAGTRWSPRDRRSPVA